MTDQESVNQALKYMSSSREGDCERKERNEDGEALKESRRCERGIIHFGMCCYSKIINDVVV